MTYDPRGLVAAITNGTGQTLSLTHTPAGLVDTVRAPDFDSSPDIADVTMDARGQLIEITAQYPGGPGTTRYGYDANVTDQRRPRRDRV